MSKVEMSLEEIKKIIENSISPDDAIVKLHKAVIGEEKFNSMEKLNGYVRGPESVCNLMCKQFINKWGTSGGLMWMNYGFGVEKDEVSPGKCEFDISEIVDNG